MELAKFTDLVLPIFPPDAVVDYRRIDQLPPDQTDFVRLVGFHAGTLSLRAAIDMTRVEHQRLVQIPAMRRLGVGVVPFQFGLVPSTPNVRTIAEKNPNVMSNDFEQLPRDYLLAAAVRRVLPADKTGLLHSPKVRKLKSGVNTFDKQGATSSSGMFLGDIWERQFLYGTLADSRRQRNRFWLVDIEPRVTTKRQ